MFTSFTKIFCTFTVAYSYDFCVCCYYKWGFFVYIYIQMYIHRHAYSVAQLCMTLWDSTDCSPSGSSVHGISQVRILEWVAVSFSRGSSWPKDWTHVSCISCNGKWIFYHWATGKPIYVYLILHWKVKHSF